MVNNTAAALVNAADGGAFAPAGIVNTDGGNKGVTLRPGLSISANESVILKVSKTNTILAEAFSSADGVTPVFGGGTANVTYSGDVVADSGGKLNFKVDSRAIGAGEVSVAAAKKDTNGNISLAGAPVVINYSVTQPAAPSNIGFAGLNNNSGTISLEPGKSIGAGTGTIIIYTDNDGIFDSTNTIAQAKTAAGQNLAAAGASYSLAKTMAGADYTWSPATFAGKFIGYALLDEATGNLSAVSFGGSVPAAPSGANYSEGDLALLNLEYQDASNLKLKSSGNLSQADMKVLATANGGANWYELGVTDAANAFSASGNNLPVAQYTASSAVRYAFKNAAGNVSQASNQDGEVVTVSKFGTGNIAIGNDRAITVYFTGSGAKVLANIADAQNIVTISTAKSGAAITFGTGAGDFAKDASGTSISMNIDVSVHALDRAEPNCAWKAHADANNIVSLNGGHAVAPASGLKGSFIQWTAMGSGTDNGVLKLITAPDGTIYVAGQFTTANGASANHVAKYSNGNWSTFVDSGTSVNGITGGNAHALAYDSANGILYVGGDYSQAGGKAIPWLAKWSNATSTWSAVGVPADGPDNFVRNLLLTPDGKFLYAGGYFNSSGKKFIMKYDITNNVWTQVGGGTNGGVFAMAYDQASNSIYVGGEFSECYNSGSAVNVGSPRAAKWNITNDTWEPLGEGLTFRDVKSIAIGTGGAVYYGGIYSGGGGGYLKKWNATSWSNVGSVNEEVKALLFDSVNSILYVGGCFSSPDGVSTMNKIALYDPAANTWSNAGAGMNQGIYTLTLDADGTLYAGGDFTSAGEVTNGDTIMNHISKR
ncbi:MAG TPA: hypothetical protein PK467_00755 [Candidatus Wallbacteria bacterium]|nr:hypothetical protein [Candidatus Wallbacteria bacterium]